MSRYTHLGLHSWAPWSPISSWNVWECLRLDPSFLGGMEPTVRRESCGPGVLLPASALPPPTITAFPARTHPCTHPHMCTYCLTLSPAHHIHRSGAYQPTHTVPKICTQRGTDTSEEKRLQGLLLRGGQENKARHLGIRWQFPFLGPVLCFRTNPPLPFL